MARLILLLLFPAMALAAYPEKPITMIVAYSPLRFLTPAQFAEVIRDADAGFRQLYKEMPWGDK